MCVCIYVLDLLKAITYELATSLPNTTGLVCAD